MTGDERSAAPQDQRGAIGLNRRTALASGVGLGIGLPVLAACGSDGGTTSRSAGDVTDAPTTSPASGAEKLVATADVPVGGGVIVDQVVVSQPEEGSFRAFKAICTHQQCAITKIDETIDCTCHFSRFALADGSVVEGPAKSPLAVVDIVVEGDSVFRA